MLNITSLFTQHLGGIKGWVHTSKQLPSTLIPVEASGISLNKISFYSTALLQSHSLSHSLTLSARGNMHFHVPAVGTAIIRGSCVCCCSK